MCSWHAPSQGLSLRVPRPPGRQQCASLLRPYLPARAPVRVWVTTDRAWAKVNVGPNSAVRRRLCRHLSTRQHVPIVMLTHTSWQTTCYPCCIGIGLG